VHSARLAVLTALAAFLIGVLPAAAVTNDWGTWTFTGQSKSWSGTFFDSHRVTGFVMGTKSLARYNNLTSFKIGSHTCKLSSSHGTAYCYYVSVPANKKLNWPATTRRGLTSSAQLVPCIEYHGSFHCRYGNG